MIKPKQSHRSTRYQKQILRNLIILVVILILAATVGLKLLINISIMVADFTKSGTATPQNQTDNSLVLLRSPKIYDIVTATNSAIIDISGTTTKGKTTKIYVNNDEYKRFISDSDEFDARIRLEEGDNEVYVEVTDIKTDLSKQSPVYNVRYITKKPTLNITSPQTESTVNTDQIRIEGETDSDVLIRINSIPVVVDGEGRFSYNLRLKEGDNDITIEAEDIVSNIVTERLKIRYEKEE